ncbi:MAG TPA: DUF5689 domain-containing protein [Williamwhitmania sp.]|nr:DUF5689 domain-containing protein [Williamwhitmania sp.]
MKTKIINSILGLLIVSALALNYGCVKESIDTVPSPVYKSSWHGNMTIAKLKSYNPGSSVGKIGTLVQTSDTIFVEGIVVSNDASQNFYKTVTIQDSTGGIDLKINDSSPLYLTYGFVPGQKVIIHANDLYLYNYNGGYQVCSAIFDNNVVASGGMSPSVVNENVQLDGALTSVSPTEVTIPQIVAAGAKSKYIQTLIKLDNVQFIESDLSKTWADPGAITNRTLVDADGNSILVRTSNFATFANETLPSGTGSMVAVLSIYGSDYQLFVRDLSDVNMDANPRTFDVLFNEGFGTATLLSPITINGWKDIATAGTKTWIAKEYPAGSGAKYAEISAYNSGQVSNVAWLISPAINLPTGGGTNYLSFVTEYAYWAAGTTLQAYVSTDFDGTNVTNATWTELTTAKFAASPAVAQYTWVNSGKVDLSAFSGNVYIAFKYTGSGTTAKTTTFDVDNVMVYNLEQQ